MAPFKGKIVIAADPFGEELKDSVVAHLKRGGYEARRPRRRFGAIESDYGRRRFGVEEK